MGFKLRIRVRQALFALIIYLPLIDLFLGSTYFVYLYNLLIVLLILADKGIKKNKKKFLLLTTGVTVVTTGLALLHFVNIPNIYSHAVCYLKCICIFTFFTDKTILEAFSSYFRKKYKGLIIECVIIIIVDGILLFLPSGYVTTWMGSFYKGTSLIPHTAAYLMNAVLLILLLLYYQKNRAVYLIGCIFPLVIISKTGARSALVGTIVIMYLFVDYMTNKHRKRTIIRAIKAILVLSALGLCMVYLFADTFVSSAIASKIFARTTSNDVFAGRTAIWVNLLEHYFHDSSILQVFFGHGDDMLYAYNYSTFRASIWSHNDAVQILVGKGLFAFAMYIFILAKSYIFTIKINKSFNTIVVWMFIVGLSLLNGLYPYLMSTLYIPCLLMLLYSTSTDQIRTGKAV